MIKYNNNVCDQIENELQIHFTKFCPNNCPFCVDKFNEGVGFVKPSVDVIYLRISEFSDKIDSIGISGGEPFVFMDELKQLISLVKTNYPHIKIGIISSIPEICYSRHGEFFSILDSIDKFAFSPQHYIESVADKVRGHISSFDRQLLYQEIAKRYADKTTVNINAFKPYLCKKEDIVNCVMHYNNMGFKNIKLSEMFDRDDMFINIEEVLGITDLKSPFAHGCSTKNYDTSKIMPDFRGNLTIKRVCFFKTKHRHANFADICKISTRWMFQKKYMFGVVYEDGTVKPYWE